MVKDSALSPKKKDWKLSFWFPLKWHQISHFYSFLCLNIIVFVMLLNDIFFFSGKPISWALLNPSVSPFKVSANGMVVESSNPAVRLYRYNTFTGEVCLFLYTLYRYFMCTFFSTKNIRPYTLFRNWKFMLDETAKFEILENKKIFFILCNFGFVTLMLWFMLIAHATVANPKWKKR